MLGYGVPVQVCEGVEQVGAVRGWEAGRAAADHEHDGVRFGAAARLACYGAEAAHGVDQHTRPQSHLARSLASSLRLEGWCAVPQQSGACHARKLPVALLSVLSVLSIRAVQSSARLV